MAKISQNNGHFVLDSSAPWGMMDEEKRLKKVIKKGMSTKLTSQQFYAKCVHTGKTAKIAVREFLALLPEAEDRQIYLEHGMSSVFEFAAKLGGVSREQVLLTLRLEERFEDLPQLKQALLSAEVPIHKLARVASVATAETQDFWLNQTKLLTKQALETLVKDTRIQSKSVPRHALNPNKIRKIQKVYQSNELHLSSNIRQRLLVLQNKGINLEELIEEFLDQREKHIQDEKQEMGEESNKSPERSRYIPARVKAVLQQEFGTKCAQEKCPNKATNIHHTRRFALNSSHNPLYLAPLCKSHHEIAHAVDVKVVEYKRGGRADVPYLGN